MIQSEPSPFTQVSGDKLDSMMRQYIIDAFCYMFPQEKITEESDFFALGGTSSQLGELQYRCIELALSRRMIEQGRSPKGIAKLCMARPRIMQQTKERYPLSKTQEGIYIESVKEHGHHDYSLHILLHLTSATDIKALRLAMQQAANIHPGLATRMQINSEGHMEQYIDEQADLYPDLLSVDCLDSLERSVKHPFDWEHEPLFHWAIYQSPTASYLYLRAHYLIMDRWALRVLLEDIDKIYRGNEVEQERVNPFAPALREEYLRGEELYQEAKEWFLTQFAGIEVDSLPLADSQVDDAGYEQIRLHWKQCPDAIKAFCNTKGISPTCFFSSALSLMLARWNNEKESLFSLIDSARNTKLTERLVTLLAKPLPLYATTEGIERVDDYLRAVQEQIFETRNNSIFSFAELSEATGVQSKLMFSYGMAGLEDMDFCGAPLHMEELGEQGFGGELSLQAYEKAEGFELLFSFARASYSPAFVQEMADSLLLILDGLVQQDLLANISITTAQQKEKLKDFNPNDSISDCPETLVSLFEQQVRQQGDKVGLVCAERQYSYNQLDRISAKLAGELIRRGVKEGQVVSVLVDRNEWMLIAALGVMRCGAVYQPLDPNYPSERLNYMIHDASACFVIADDALLHLITEYEGDVLSTADICSLPTWEKPLPRCSADAHYVILYTSGSTGQAKGCMLRHRNMVSLVYWLHDFYQMDAGVKCPVYASYGFDAHMIDHYSPLLAGGTLYVIEDDMRLDLIGLEQYFNHVGITHAFLTTQVGRQFALSAQVKTMRYLSMGGEALVPLPPPKDFTLMNLYGPTECTVAVTHYPVTENIKHMRIGRPMARTKLYVVDSAGRLQAPGAQGELLIAGAQVADGYLNRPELSEKTFVPNCYDSEAGYERLYRTGDVVRWLPDGQLEFIGRRDAQVKIRGFRIELSEVESILRDFEGIKDVTVQAFASPAGGKFMAAYIVGEEEIDQSALRDFVAASKPAYMVPEIIMQIDAIPLTPNQKVNRRALPDPLAQRVAEDAIEEDATPNMLEEQLRSMLQELLGNTSIGLHTPFVHAGLSSIAAIKLSVMVYKRYQVRLDARKLLREGTIVHLENKILEHLLEAEHAEQSTVPSQDTVHGYPLSASQLGIFYECLKKPESTVYNLPALLRFGTDCSVEQLQQALRDCIAAHPAFSLRFDTSQGTAQQLYADFVCEIGHHQLSEQELPAHCQSFVRPFDLMTGPLYRMEILQSPQAHYVLIDFHHLISDGYSMDLFMRELCSRLEGHEPETEAISVFDAIDIETRANQQEAEQFFANQLIDFEASTELESDYEGSNAEEELGEEGEHQVLIAPLPVDNACKNMGISPAELFLSCLSLTLVRYVNSNSIYINMVSSGRNDPRLSDTMGMFVKTLPLSIQLGEESVMDFGKKISHLLAETLEHEHYPYAKIAADYGYKPSIVYAYQVGLLSSYQVGGQDVEMNTLSTEAQRAMFKLGIFIEWHEGQYAIVLRYDKNLYSAALMSHLGDSLRFVLSQLVEKPEQPAKHISLITPEREEQLQGFRCVAQSDIPIKLLHQGLEEHARNKPQHRALVACDGEWSYEQFNAMANRIAHNLIAQGVQPGMRVAMLLPRTSALVCTIFGILKAGAAYIPCDPDYPADRVRHVLDDSEARFIITNKAKLADFEDGLALDVEELLQGEDKGNPDLSISSDSLAYLIYTSGSTGRPKGAMLRHHGICSYLTPHPANFEMEYMSKEVSAMLAVSTIAFDITLIEVVNPLFNGFTLVLANDDETHSPVELARLFVEAEVDCFCATPSRYIQFMDLPEFCEGLARCKALVVAGEMFPKALLKKLQAMTKARIYNVYGPTETTVSCNTADVTHSDRVDVGRPLLNYIEFIVDDDGNELPAGLVGELYIGGPGVALGYHHLDELTAKQFIHYKGERVYKSGDYACWTEDGAILVQGRKDNQVKLRGLRIELGEIESCLTQIEGIKQAAITIRKLSGGSEELCAHFAADRIMDVEYLRQELGKKLTPYMVPSLWLQMDSLPQTPNGKTDLRALPDPVRQGIERTYVAPVGEKEELFCTIFARILGLDRVSAEESFFDLGGTSLVATRVIIEANKAGIRLSYGELFSHATARKLAHMGEESSSEAVGDEFSQYDYSPLHQLLESNTLEKFQQGEQQKMGTVLLAGATGFLGIHILKQLLDTESDPIYCLLRSHEQDADGTQRLQSLLHYYFNNSYAELIGTRILPITGDLNSLAEAKTAHDIDTVINCAANVKHFSQTQDIAEVNLGGVDRLIEFCLAREARLVHISTISVSGLSVNQYPAPDRLLKEQDLYIGQNLDNQYTGSKFLAERHILEAMQKSGLSAKIMRVGNLSPRYEDGVFQVNAQTNSSMGRLRSFKLLGCCPYEVLSEPIEFSPIDETARAVLLLAKTPKDCCVFHPYNPQNTLMSSVIFSMKPLGLRVKSVENADYQIALNRAKIDPEKVKYLASIIAYQDMAHGQDFQPVELCNDYTMQVLYRMGYHWPQPSTGYLQRFLKKLIDAKYFI